MNAIEHSLEFLDQIKNRMFRKGKRDNVFVTYANDVKTDGAGAQFQRIYGIYALSRALDLKYVHTPVSKVGNLGLVASVENVNSQALTNHYNKIFHISSDISELNDPIIHYKKNATLNDIARIRKQARYSNRNHLIKMFLPYKILDKHPSYYRWATAISPFECNHDRSTIRIAIHVRRGDLLVKHSDRMLPNRYYISLANSIANILEMQRRSYIFELYTEVPASAVVVNPLHTNVQGRSEENLVIDPAGYGIEEFNEIPNMVSYNNHDQIKSLINMATADILITSHSSFSYLAGILNKNGLVVYHPFWHSPLPGWIVVEGDTVPESSLRRFSTAI